MDTRGLPASDGTEWRGDDGGGAAGVPRCRRLVHPVAAFTRAPSLHALILASRGCAGLGTCIFLYDQDEPKAHRHAIPVPGCHQQHEAQPPKLGMILANKSFMNYRIFGAAFVGMTAVAKEVQHAVGGWRP